MAPWVWVLKKNRCQNSRLSDAAGSHDPVASFSRPCAAVGGGAPCLSKSFALEHMRFRVVDQTYWPFRRHGGRCTGRGSADTDSCFQTSTPESCRSVVIHASGARGIRGQTGIDRQRDRSLIPGTCCRTRSCSWEGPQQVKVSGLFLGNRPT